MHVVTNAKHGAQIIPILLSSPRLDPNDVHDSLTALDLACHLGAKDCVQALLVGCDGWNLTRVAGTAHYLATHFRTLTDPRTGRSLLYKFRPGAAKYAMCLLAAYKRRKLTKDVCNLLLNAVALHIVLDEP